MNERESAAMWELYAKRGSGVAITSTFARLRASVHTSDDEASYENYFISPVIYKDYDSEDEKDAIPLDNGMYPYITKRKSFEHERELRAMINMHPDILPPHGKYLACDLRTLIEQVFVSPASPQWFTDLIRAVCKRYRLSAVQVRQSRLDDSPFALF